MLLAERVMKFACAGVLAWALSCAIAAHPQEGSKPAPAASAKDKKTAADKKPAVEKTPTAAEELQQTIDAAGNDRAALVRNLEGYLVKYPEASQRPQIYRALVEASLQLRDTAKAAGYAERVVALTPED